MVVKVYISGISGNKEVKKRQQRVSMILDSKSIKYEIIDITEPGRESDKDFMQNNSKSNGGTVSDPNPRSPLPPQLFNDEEYCGDYDEFDLANEVDTLEQFLKVEVPPEVPQAEDDKEKAVNGEVIEENKASKENSQERETLDAEKPVENEENGKEGSPVKEETPAKEGTPLRESSPTNEPLDATNENDEEAKGDPPKETTPERQKSVEKEETVTEKEESPVKEVESKASKENTPEIEESVNANGDVSSRDQSEEKEAAVDESTVERKKDPSEALIQSEQTTAAE